MIYEDYDEDYGYAISKQELYSAKAFIPLFQQERRDRGRNSKAFINKRDKVKKMLDIYFSAPEMTMQEISKQCELSPSTCHKYITEYEKGVESGVIKKSSKDNNCAQRRKESLKSKAKTNQYRKENNNGNVCK